MEARLNKWIAQYVLSNPGSAGEDTKAKYALSAAEVTVEEIEGNPRYYSAKFYLRPHYQLEGLTCGWCQGYRRPKAAGSDVQRQRRRGLGADSRPLHRLGSDHDGLIQQTEWNEVARHEVVWSITRTRGGSRCPPTRCLRASRRGSTGHGPVAEDVEAAVTDVAVGEPRVVRSDESGDHGGAHPRVFVFDRRPREDGAVRELDRGADAVGVDGEARVESEGP